MRHWSKPREWSIATRMLVITVVPVAALFISVVLWIYIAGRLGAINSVKRNGELLVAALAQTSQFAVLSANSEGLSRSIQRMLKARVDVSSIEVLDEQRHQIAFAGQNHSDQKFTFEQKISDDTPDIDLFGGNSPHVVSSDVLTLPLRPERVIGYVRVYISPVPVLEEERFRLFLAGLARRANSFF